MQNPRLALFRFYAMYCMIPQCVAIYCEIGRVFYSLRLRRLLGSRILRATLQLNLYCSHSKSQWLTIKTKSACLLTNFHFISCLVFCHSVRGAPNLAILLNVTALNDSLNALPFVCCSVVCVCHGVKIHNYFRCSNCKAKKIYSSNHESGFFWVTSISCRSM